MSNREIKFRESFRGYNRDDVSAYIEHLNFIFSRKEADMHAYITELEAKVNTAPQQAASSHSDEEWDTVNASLNDANEEIARLKSELETVKQNVESEDFEKSKLYDTMSSQVGNILIVANNNAEKIVADANIEASRIKNEADIYAESVKKEAEKIKNDTISGINEQVKNFADQCSEQYTNIIFETNEKLSSITDNVKNRSESIRFVFDTKINELTAKLTGTTEG